MNLTNPDPLLFPDDEPLKLQDDVPNLPPVPGMPPVPPSVPGMPPVPPPPAAQGAAPPPLPDVGLAPELQSLTNDGPPARDRVVVLGRTQAGKTVFVARLYEQLWNSRSAEIHMRALSGPPHVKFMQMISSMREGRWPDATGGRDYVDVEVTFAGRKFRMTLLDYPGETFSKAFVLGQTDAEDTKDLVEHIDRAAGVIMLIDPQNAVESRDQAKRADDDFGMQQVLHRIRSFPNGQNVPVAIVLTKADQRQQLVQSLGGLEPFARTYLSNLLRPAGRVSKLFMCVAVWSRTSSRTGKSVPDLDREPLKLVNPLAWVLKKLIDTEAAEARQTQVQQMVSAVDAAAQEALRVASDASLPLQDRIMQGSARMAAARALGGENHPLVAQTREMLAHLQDRSERQSERRFWIILGLALALVAGAALWFTWRWVVNRGAAPPGAVGP